MYIIFPLPKLCCSIYVNEQLVINYIDSRQRIERIFYNFFLLKPKKILWDCSTKIKFDSKFITVQSHRSKKFITCFSEEFREIVYLCGAIG